MTAASPPLTREATLAELPYFDLHITDQANGAEVAQLFEQDRALPGVLVLRGPDIIGMVSRHQFFQRLSRLYGIEVYLGRPISVYLDALKNPCLCLPQETRIQAAVLACLARPLENVYDPLVVTFPQGPPRLIDFFALILKQTDLLHTAQQETENQKAQAIAANNAKSAFLATMSHELRTPLTAIIGYGEILLEDAESHPTEALPHMAGRLQNIVSASFHLLEMINGILDLSKIEAGRMELNLEEFILVPFLEEIVTTATVLMLKNQNSFVFNPSAELGLMFSDRTKLRQCLLNLLGNAAKFTREGRVELQIRAVENELIFHISDTGIGMNPDQQKHLFEPFYQVDSSISRQYGGTGLGLTLTRRNCEMLGGSLTVQSELGAGTSFTMKLPRRTELE